MLDEDIMKIDAAYYDAGMVNVKVGTPEVVTDERHARVIVKVPIVEGDVYRLGAIAFKGVAAGDVAQYRRELGVKSGDIFTRSALAGGLDKLRSLERDHGRTGDVTPDTAIDSTRHVIDLTIEVAP
jgi:outer membrane protein insertion porin family